MLNEPYIKIDSNADYDLHILAEGVSPLHLAITHKEKYITSEGTDSEEDVNVMTSMKLLPLNHLVLSTLHLVDTATPIGDVDGKLDYAPWIPAIANGLRGTLASMTVKGDINDHLDFPATTRNKIVKGLIEDRELILLGVENRGVMSRVYWLGRMNSEGDLSMASVSEFGTKRTVSTDVVMYGLSRNSIPSIMNYVREFYAANAPDSTVVVEGDPIGDEIKLK